MGLYRKKPVVVEAWQYEEGSIVPSWLADARYDGRVTLMRTSNEFSTIMLINTLEGTMEARIGDWIIKGVKGELYPCKNDIFEQTYEPALEGEVRTGFVDREHIHQFFSYEHLPEHLQKISKKFSELAQWVSWLPRNPERTVALRKLLEAKDAAVRAAIAKD